MTGKKIGHAATMVLPAKVADWPRWRRSVCQLSLVAHSSPPPPRKCSSESAHNSENEFLINLDVNENKVSASKYQTKQHIVQSYLYISMVALRKPIQR